VLISAVMASRLLGKMVSHPTSINLAFPYDTHLSDRGRGFPPRKLTDEGFEDAL
jgi:hypothetical protein